MIRAIGLFQAQSFESIVHDLLILDRVIYAELAAVNGQIPVDGL